jgi:hypothetical protein
MQRRPGHIEPTRDRNQPYHMIGVAGLAKRIKKKDDSIEPELFNAMN